MANCLNEREVIDILVREVGIVFWLDSESARKYVFSHLLSYSVVTVLLEEIQKSYERDNMKLV
jgi:hypothetical protein